MATTEELLQQAQTQAQELKSSFESFKANKQPATAIDVGVMEQPTEPLDVEPPMVDEGVVGQAVASANALVTEAQTNLQKKEAEAAQKESSVSSLMDTLAGRTAERTSLLDDAGIVDSQKDLADLITNIKSRTAALAEFDDTTFLGEEELRQQSAGRDITKGVFGAKANQRRLQRAIERTGRAATLRVQTATAELMQNNIAAATAEIDAALDAKYAPIEASLEKEMLFLQRQWQKADTADQRLYSARMNKVQQEQNAITDAKDMVNNAMAYATPAELQAMNDPELSAQEQYQKAQEVVSRGLRQDRNYELQQRNLNLALSNQKLSSAIAAGASPATTSAAIEAMYQSPSSGSIRNTLASLMQSLDVPATQRSNIGTVFDVAGSIENLANRNPEGEFYGLGKGFSMGALNNLWLTDEQMQERSYNRADVEAINLKVQQWASGAALTEAQTEQVEKITPRASDTDGEVRRKTNALYNFMLGVTETQLVTSGYNVQFPEIDLYEHGDLLMNMSPEQKQIYEDALLEANQTTTPAYGIN